MTNQRRPTPDAIQAATAQLAIVDRAFAERFWTAQRLLTRSRWSWDGTTARLGTHIATRQACTCQEGWGPIVCLHRVAAQILAYADGVSDPVGGDDRPPAAPAMCTAWPQRSGQPLPRRTIAAAELARLLAAARRAWAWGARPC